MAREEQFHWAPPIGAALVILLFTSIALIAAGGWEWFAGFLTGQASSWVQAIGSILAILAGFIWVERQLKGQRDAADEAARIKRVETLRALCTLIPAQVVGVADALVGIRLDPTWKPMICGFLRHGAQQIQEIGQLNIPDPVLSMELTNLRSMFLLLAIKLEAMVPDGTTPSPQLVQDVIQGIPMLQKRARTCNEMCFHLLVRWSTQEEMTAYMRHVRDIKGREKEGRLLDFGQTAVPRRPE